MYLSSKSLGIESKIFFAIGGIISDMGYKGELVEGYAKCGLQKFKKAVGIGEGGDSDYTLNENN